MENKEIEKVNKQEIESRAKNFKAAPGFTTTLVPRSFNEALRMAEILCKSDCIPKSFQGKPASVLIAIGMGMELGLPPLQAIQNIMVVNGRPTIWGDLVPALILGNPICEIFDEDAAHVALKQGYGRCLCKRKGRKAVEVIFTIEDAKKAGLWGKAGPWTNYPGRMLQMRARSWSTRDTFADVLKGFAIREEVEDYVEVYANPKTYASTPMPTEAPPATPEMVDSVVEEGQAAEEKKVDNSEIPNNQSELISESDRKDLFNQARIAGISMESFKQYLWDQHAIKSSADIPYGVLPVIQKWIG